MAGREIIVISGLKVKGRGGWMPFIDLDAFN
jgi:hypothetical protein